MNNLNVLRLSHLCVRVTNLEAAEEFYVNVLGFSLTEKDGDHLYLKGIEEGQHHSLVLKKASSPGLCYVGFRVRNVEDVKLLDRVQKFNEKGVNEAYLTQSPNGIPLLFYEEMEYVGDVRLKFNLHKGSSPVRLAHVNFMVKNLEKEERFFKEQGFVETERFLNKDGKKTVTWLTKRGNSHEVALAESEKNVPGFHHETYYVHDLRDVVRVADLLSSLGYWDSIERGPGRHGASEGYYIYIRDLDKNRLEFFNSDYEVLDLDKWRPVVWTQEQYRFRSDFWGRPIPESWHNEWMPVEDLNGEMVRWEND
ncbi:MAG: 3,4-dihydroxyphenylacetate 2,3-dioxygenase [Metallosphaera sp.]